MRMFYEIRWYAWSLMFAFDVLAIIAVVIVAEGPSTRSLFPFWEHFIIRFRCAFFTTCVCLLLLWGTVIPPVNDVTFQHS